MAIRHAKVSGVTDTADTSLVRPSDWNADHVGGVTEALLLACSDELTPIAVEAAVVTFRMPYDFTVEAVRASLTESQTAGSAVTIDVQANGVSILSTLVTIDNNQKTSTTAATQSVVSTTALTDDDEITIDVTQIGNGTATGLKVAVIGSKT